MQLEDSGAEGLEMLASKGWESYSGDSGRMGGAVDPLLPSPPQTSTHPPAPLLQDSRGIIVKIPAGSRGHFPGVGARGGYRHITLLETISLGSAGPLGILPRPGRLEETRAFPLSKAPRSLEAFRLIVIPKHMFYIPKSIDGVNVMPVRIP